MHTLENRVKLATHTLYQSHFTLEMFSNLHIIDNNVFTLDRLIIFLKRFTRILKVSFHPAHILMPNILRMFKFRDRLHCFIVRALSMCEQLIPNVTCVCVRPSLAARSALSGRARYWVCWKRWLSACSCRLEQMVRGFLIFFPFPLSLTSPFSITAVGFSCSALEGRTEGRCSEKC